ncbi:protein FAM200B-like [Aphis craccivora]|uniref:Protein FAM200B-like n=1 Tax=Aphis craccivora TaxID=307492 RepID=A0A6G0X1E5_APHCR|nr:protein FAM200B-like [Aphis craccivora]
MKNTGFDMYDIGSYIQKNITLNDHIKYNLLVSHWKPPKNFDFPFSTHNKKGKEEKRFLRTNHLEKYSWLVYSKASKSVYCLYCSVFVSTNIGCGNKNYMLLKALVTEPLVRFDKLLGTQGSLETHEKNQYHIKAIQDGKHFIKNFNDPNRGVINQIDSHRLRVVKENRERLKQPIIKTLIFLAKQNIPLRGHRDDGSIFDNQNELMGNEGNFRELIKFRIESGDLTLKCHLEDIEKRATYISKTTQNELISILGDSILQKILEHVKKSQFYSIMFDETTEMSHTSQLVIVIRYIKNNSVREDLIGFVDCHKENFDLSTEEPKMTGEMIG